MRPPKKIDVAVSPKKEIYNTKNLTNNSLRIKHILKLWYGLARTMKLVEYQTNEDCKKFQEN